MTHDVDTEDNIGEQEEQWHSFSLNETLFLDSITAVDSNGEISIGTERYALSVVD